MKAIAKHDCSVTLTLDLNTLSLNRIGVKKGDVLEYPIREDKELKMPISKHLGERSVIFEMDGWLVPTYSKDFDYIED